MKYVLAWLVMAFAMAASATSVPQMPLEDMVRLADHVVVANVTRVDMVDGRGRAVTDPQARTGPGLKNQIRLHLRVKQVLFSRAGAVPPTLTVPLWTMWHYQLGDMQEVVSEQDSVFLLKGDGYEPAYRNGFQRSLDEKQQIEQLLAPR